MDNWVPILVVFLVLVFAIWVYANQKQTFKEQLAIFQKALLEKAGDTEKVKAENKVLRAENSRLRRKLGEAALDDDVFPSRQVGGLKFRKRGGNEDGTGSGGVVLEGPA